MKNYLKLIAGILVILSLCSNAFSQKIYQNKQAQKETHEGNEWYKKKDYSAAKEAYSKSLLNEQNNPVSLYNMGNAIYKSDDIETARKAYEAAIENNQGNKKLQAQSYHNIGNTYAKENKWQEAVNAYKSALKLDPSNNDTKYNLAYAMEKLKQQQNNNKDKNNQNKDDSNKDKQDNKQEQNKNDDKNKNDKDNKESESKDENKEQKEQPTQHKSTPSKLDKQQAENLLNALRQEEVKQQKDKNKKKNIGIISNKEKDW